MNSRLYTPTFFLAVAFNFLISLNFTSNAIYPLYITYEGGGAKTVGLFMSVLAVAAVLGRPLIGLIIDRFGVKPVLLLGSLLLGIPPLGFLMLLGSGITPMVWLLRFVQGFGLGAYFSAFFTLAAQIAPEGRRNEAVSMYGISGLAANLLGPIIGERISKGPGLPAFFLLMTIFALGAFLLITQMKINKLNDTTSLKPGKIWEILRKRDLHFVLLLAMLLAVSFSTAYNFLAPVAMERGIEDFGLYFTGFAVTGIAIRLIGSRWGDRLGWRRVLAPSFILYCLGLFTLHLSVSLTGIIIAGLINGIAHGIAFPAVASLGYTMAPKNSKGTAMALITGMMDVGIAVSAFLLGQSAGIFGYAVVFPIAAVAPFAAVLFVVIGVLRNPKHISKAIISTGHDKQEK